MIDTERGSASKYADRHDSDVVALDSFRPERYVEAIDAAERAVYRVLVIDSRSHAWEEEGVVLSLVDEASRRSSSAPAFRAACCGYHSPRASGQKLANPHRGRWGGVSSNTVAHRTQLPAGLFGQPTVSESGEGPGRIPA